MFKSSGSLPLSPQKQQFQFYGGNKKKSENKTPAELTVFSWPGEEGSRSDLSVLEVAQCAFISNQHRKQTLTDLFPFFTFALVQSLLIMRKHTAQIY